MIPAEVRAEATTVAGQYLQILNADETMTPGELDAFSVGVQAGIVAALGISQRDLQAVLDMVDSTGSVVSRA